MASTGFKLAAATILGLSGLLGCQTKPEQPEHTHSGYARSKYPFTAANSIVQTIEPVYRGNLSGAKEVMRQKSLGTLKESAFLYLPDEKLLFDIGLLEESGLVYASPTLENAIMHFYRKPGIKFHTHIDYYDKELFGRLYASVNSKMQETKQTLDSCLANKLHFTDFLIKCNPASVKNSITELEYLQYLVNDPQTLQAVQSNEKIFLSYTPSINDLNNFLYSPVHGAGRKAGVIVVNPHDTFPIVWYDVNESSDLDWYWRKNFEIVYGKSSFTKSKMDAFIKESERHGVKIIQEDKTD